MDHPEGAIGVAQPFLQGRFGLMHPQAAHIDGVALGAHLRAPAGRIAAAAHLHYRLGRLGGRRFFTLEPLDRRQFHREAQHAAADRELEAIGADRQHLGRLAQGQ